MPEWQYEFDRNMIFNLKDKTIYQKADFYFPVSSSKLYNKHNIQCKPAEYI